jgi:glycosyltransferase involved in cell wall biosynthesis
MRIAQVAPLYESVPPRLYGGTERVVSWLTEELVRRGHEVTLFASGDSVTAARLVPGCDHSLRLDPGAIDYTAHHVRQLEQVFGRAHEFDVVHFHTDYLHFPLSRRHGLCRLTTLHGRLDIPDLVPLYREFPHEPVVSISDAQRRPLPWIGWVQTVHHGLPRGLFSPGAGAGGYLAFVGRFSPEKAPHLAVEIARRAGLPLKMAAKLDTVDREYFERVLQPVMDPGFVEWVGELGDAEKDALLGGARAVLFPIAWEEPFGLVQIEAMACGTPVVAFRRGSVPEICTEGVTGFIVEGVEGAVAALRNLDGFDRARCRRAFEHRYSAERMAEDYERVYQRLMEDHAGANTPALASSDRGRALLRSG